MDIGKRIRSARKDRNLTQADLAQLLGKDKQTIYRWEKSERNISLDNLKAIASVLGYDIMFFIDRSDTIYQSFDFIMNPKTPDLASMKIGDRIRERREALGMDIGQFVVHSNYVQEAIYKWEHSLEEPDMETIRYLARKLNTSSAYLLGETNDPNLNITDEENNNYASESAIHTSDLIKLTMYAIPTVVSCEMGFMPLQRSKGVGRIFTKIDIFAVYDENNPPYAVVMPNNSMRGADIDEGDIVVVNPAEPAENGKPAFVIYNGAGIIRWILQKADGSIELQTANTDYASITVEQKYVNDALKYRVVGRVVEVLSSKKPKDAF